MDITAAKLAEEEMHRAQADLTRVTRIATMAELTASIAHEINQPISGVLTNSEACLRWINRPEPDLDEAREAVERSVVGARRVRERKSVVSGKSVSVRVDLVGRSII